jgi:hypothetical protein
LPVSASPETLVAINPMWAELIARDVPDIEDVTGDPLGERLAPLELWPESYAGP